MSYVGYRFIDMYQLYKIKHWDKHQIKGSACLWDGGTWEWGTQVTTTVPEITFVKKSEKDNYEQ